MILSKKYSVVKPQNFHSKGFIGIKGLALPTGLRKDQTCRFLIQTNHLLHYSITNTILDGCQLFSAFISFYSLGNNPQLQKLE